MRAVIQKVSSSCVRVEGRITGSIGKGFMVLLGISTMDTAEDLSYIEEKISGLRIFEDNDGKMNLPLSDVGGEILVVSQFTLYGDARKGRRPSFIQAAKGPEAEALYEELLKRLRSRGFRVETGEFGAMMEVTIVNDGPVTILLDSDKKF
ncbi:D-aminoacyl-tRNA deacylase [Youngiibacter multivorans]|uniref:D-aminoacyl-tRNA deacylase n=1 Tax=Youngiibacter multivorans TaxID=937251 RepID=A0ABS4G1F0_9CLOT|nr:D-aminoacyl-tRNA deacylase [Youngiibacter multivorans]MBP1918170.1 D-tyrosyl-tRNA(Tyr) deacylase [Youngiibacter multivorans]